MTGVPMMGVMALSGRMVSCGSMQRMLQRRAMAPPITMVVGRRRLWLSLRQRSRAMWGVASPMNATGPQNAVEMAVRSPVEQSRRGRT